MREGNALCARETRYARVSTSHLTPHTSHLKPETRNLKPAEQPSVCLEKPEWIP
jgi:hypothetical protein